MTNKEKFFLLVGGVEDQACADRLIAIIQNHNERNFIAFDETGLNELTAFVQLVDSKYNFMVNDGVWEWLSPGFCEMSIPSSLSLYNPEKQLISYKEASIPFQLEHDEKKELLDVLEMARL